MIQMILPIASVRGTIADYVEALFIVYFVLIFVRILLTWIPRMPFNRYLRAAVAFIEEVTDPYLNLFRRFIPLLRIGPGAIDLSPIVAIIVLSIVRTLVVNAVAG